MTPEQPPPAPHVIQPPPQDDPTVAHVAEILAAGVVIEATIAGLLNLLRPLKLSRQAITAALRISGRGTNPTPRPKGYHDLARAAARQELYFRAAYFLRACIRIQADLNAGMTIVAAIQREGRYQQQHEQARQQRQAAMKAVIASAATYGNILGWYLNPLLHNEPECKAASGHNFDALKGTIIGYPGTVHTGCGCYPGEPHYGAGSVDDAVKPHVVYGKIRLLRPVRRKAS